MVLIQKLELETTELFKQKEYSKVVFEITSKTNEEERSSFLCNLLGLSRISNDNKNKNLLSIAINDFKLGFLKEKKYNSVNRLSGKLYYYKCSVNRFRKKL